METTFGNVKATKDLLKNAYQMTINYTICVDYMKRDLEKVTWNVVQKYDFKDVCMAELTVEMFQKPLNEEAKRFKFEKQSSLKNGLCVLIAFSGVSLIMNVLYYIELATTYSAVSRMYSKT